MTATLTIVIPGRPPTPNDRRHWRTVAKDNAVWKETARKATADALPDGWVPLERCRMAVVYLYPTRHEGDDDNWICAQKPCLDGIVAGGAIADDSRRVIRQRTYEAEYRKGVQATIYTIEPLELDQVGAGL